ncbi:hypothetical protein SAMN04489761_4330 [Tenacibaculum sp. MAR_2009_124]|uniref:hypothetical protein n=1 Tax=Tenacibaculum sp. MAR_2009_124 TaxID=1250059 RepID=UPI000896995F|nr:hypothetical protein [Tenacibaculum sp. MAR_2009_124]SED11893.1 hypothetical protein SAMN04489761_4330 [Tenacibaculum sp. MAR_2009_124]
MKDPIRIFKCPCGDKKYILAGKPNNTPTLKEKREHGEYIAAGCEVITISLEQFQKEKWEYMPWSKCIKS